jgi:hypothetical protein
VLSQRILKEWAAIFCNPFLFLIFLSEKRASEIIESKIQSLFQRGALMRYSLVIKTLLMCQQHLKNSLSYRI